MPTRRLSNFLRHGLVAAACAAVLLATAGCPSVSSVNRLRDAQDSFNAAAALDNREQLGAMLGPASAASGFENSTESLAKANKVRSGYAAALVSLRQIDAGERAQLQKDQLWGAVLSLQALTEWKLGLYDAALKSADQATQAKDQLFPRDAAILAALPGLIKIDLAYIRIAAMGPGPSRDTAALEELKARLVGDAGAVADLRKARQQAGPNHPITAYLIESQLAAFRNYQVAHSRTHGPNPPDDDLALVEARHNLHELQQFSKPRRPRTSPRIASFFGETSARLSPKLDRAARSRPSRIHAIAIVNPHRPDRLP